MSKLSVDGKAHLQALLDGGALGDLLEDLEAEAQSILTQMPNFNLDEPEGLASAKSVQSTVRGYMLAIGAIRTMLSGN